MNPAKRERLSECKLGILYLDNSLWLKRIPKTCPLSRETRKWIVRGDIASAVIEHRKEFPGISLHEAFDLVKLWRGEVKRHPRYLSLGRNKDSQ
jgi:hypothetical protein